MPAYRLCDIHGNQIGGIMLTSKLIEQELVNAHPKINLEYSTSLEQIVSFTLELIPNEINGAST